MNEEKPLIIYHANCADGFTAAWVATRYFKRKFNQECELHPGVYGDLPPQVEGRHVYLLDFTYRRAVVKQLAKSAATVTILDHHETAWKEYGEMAPANQGKNGLVLALGNFYAYFRRDQSGAMVTWRHFNPDATGPGLDMEALLLVKYVQDRDLWLFQEPNSKAINAWIFSHEYTEKNWDMLAATLNDHSGYGQACVEGKAIERKQFKDIKEFLATATQEVGICGFRVPVANVPYHWGSDAAHILAEGKPFAATYWQDSKGDSVWGLRSDANGEDVGAIAKAYGGGGHKHAAGFRIPLGRTLDQHLASLEEKTHAD